MSDESDQQLLERARAGDPSALAALLERHEAQIYRFGMKMCRDPEDAKDILQETLLAMARGFRDFRGASSMSTWLYAIARSFCSKKRRKRKFAPEAERSVETDAAVETNALPDPAQAPDEVLADKRVALALANAIESLEPIYREVLLLRDVEGLTAPETAEVLGVSVQAVKSRLHRARLAVRAKLAPTLGMPDVPAPSTCPDVLDLYSRHLEDEISADVCAEMERHIEGCARCRRACDSLKRTLALCKSTPVPRVPASVQQSVRVALHDFLGPRR